MNDIRDILIERGIELLRVDAHLRRQISGKLDEAQNEILELLGRTDFSRLTDWQQRKARDLVKSSQSIISAAYAGAFATHITSLQDLALIEATFTASAVGAPALSSTVERTIRSLGDELLMQGAPVIELWKRQESGIEFRLADILRQGVDNGEANGPLFKQVRELFDTSRRNAEMLTRLGVQSIANGSRRTVFEANADVLPILQQISTLDSRTTPTCRARDLKQWENAPGHKPIGHTIPFAPCPIHWGCRSTHVALPENIKSLPGSRASKDGPVPASWDFKDWLATKTVEEQDAMLGKGKAQLWRDGKITMTDLLDQTGRPMTLKELRSKFE